ncbi:tRNA lysidine(34) synthetase TilS [Sneathiella sp.]|uniref:tRNA lysidine(34) synthetase TilS n=1 Tax=Sneathiella sp. TaxID=1964365 RepID=UPI003563CDC5
MTVSDLTNLFYRNMDAAGLVSGARLAVAVSGGSDSMALVLLANDWAARRGVELYTITVDHGLRAGSALEAETVGRWLTVRGMHHDILRWAGPRPDTAIQRRAREARYDLMAEYCKDRDIHNLLLGHQMEDRLETLLMRLSKGSGLEGLTAIQPLSWRGALQLLRPLLEVRRQVLRDYLIANGQEWVEDPSNDNPVYTRTRVGALLEELQGLPGSSLETIALSAMRLNRASDALDQLTMARLSDFCEVSPFGFIRFSTEAVTGCPEEIALRFLARIFTDVAGTGQRIRLQALENLYDRVFRKDGEGPETLAGCQISRSRGSWLVCREPGRKGLPEQQVTDNRLLLWDGRYRVEDMTPTAAPELPLAVRRIGADGWRVLKAEGLTKEERELPAKVRNNLPAVWSGEKLVAAPLFSCNFAQSPIAKDRFKMLFKPLIS